MRLMRRLPARPPARLRRYEPPEARDRRVLPLHARNPMSTGDAGADQPPVIFHRRWRTRPSSSGFPLYSSPSPWRAPSARAGEAARAQPLKTRARPRRRQASPRRVLPPAPRPTRRPRPTPPRPAPARSSPSLLSRWTKSRSPRFPRAATTASRASEMRPTRSRRPRSSPPCGASTRRRRRRIGRRCVLT